MNTDADLEAQADAIRDQILQQLQAGAGATLQVDLASDVLDVRILVNENVRMSPRKMAAQAVHAALRAFGVDHGSVVVLGGRPGQIEKMPVFIRDAGLTEVKPGTLTAGCELSGPSEK